MSVNKFILQPINCSRFTTLSPRRKFARTSSPPSQHAISPQMEYKFARNFMQVYPIANNLRGKNVTLLRFKYAYLCLHWYLLIALNVILRDG